MTDRKEPEIDDINAIPTGLYPALFLILSDMEMAEAINTFAQAGLVTPITWEEHIVLVIENRGNLGEARVAMQDFVRKALEKYGVCEGRENIMLYDETWSKVTGAVSNLLDAKYVDRNRTMYMEHAQKAAIVFVNAVFKDGVNAVRDKGLLTKMWPPLCLKVKPTEDEMQAIREADLAISEMAAVLFGHERGLALTVAQHDELKAEINGAVDACLDSPLEYLCAASLSPGEPGYRHSLTDIALGRGDNRLEPGL